MAVLILYLFNLIVTMPLKGKNLATHFPLMATAENLSLWKAVSIKNNNIFISPQQINAEMMNEEKIFYLFSNKFIRKFWYHLTISNF